MENVETTEGFHCTNNAYLNWVVGKSIFGTCVMQHSDPWTTIGRIMSLICD